MTEAPERIALYQDELDSMAGFTEEFAKSDSCAGVYVRADLVEAERERLRETIRRYVQLFGALPDQSN